MLSLFFVSIGIGISKIVNLIYLAVKMLTFI